VTEPRKFPGSWWWVLAVGLAALAVEAAGTWLAAGRDAQPAAAQPGPPRSVGVAGPPRRPSGQEASPAAILARYEAELTPALDERARTYAASIGLEPGTLPSARAIFQSLVAEGSLLPPGERMHATTPGAAQVCGEQGVAYACASVAAHLDGLARWAGEPAGPAPESAAR